MEAGYGHDSANGVMRRPVPGALSLPSSSPASPSTLPMRPQLQHSQSFIHAGTTQNGSNALQPANGSKSRVIGTQSTPTMGYRNDAVPSPAMLTAPETGYDIRRVKSSSVLSATTIAVSNLQVGPSDAGISSDTEKEKDSSSKWKAALGEAQYFAGGLISHPSESNRHFSIIRHSHALVWYRGPSTSVSITILAKDPLPARRSLWLQQKGFSGDAGMAIKALTGSTGSWLDVTPQRRAQVPSDVLTEVDERGIQRDLKRFAKRASGKQKHHLPRETHIVRIPAAAADGYFRLVLCAGPARGDKVLCGSPVFRMASTSLDASVVRGASLSTMPLEVGVKVASTIGQAVVDRYTGIAQTVVKSQAGKIVARATAKNAVVGRVVQDAYQRTTASDQAWKRKDTSLSMFNSSAREEVIGPDTGPRAPFPIDFHGGVVRGTGKSIAELGIPTANLSGVSESIKMTMGGVFAAWACLQTPNSAPAPLLSTDWHEAIVTIAPPRNAPPEVAMKNAVTMHIIHDFGGIHATFYGAKIEVLLMGYLHAAAAPSASADELVVELSRDVASTLAGLGREAWAPEAAADQLRSLRGGKTFSQRVDDVTGRLYEQVDRLPLHWAGVRTESGTMQDKAYGNGGIWIPR